jgi:TrmH family RNA methyltransferase
MSGIIRSFQNARVKAASRLRQSRQRHKQGRFLIDGCREISQAMAADWPLDEVFVCHEVLDQQGAEELLELVRQTGVSILEVTSAIMKKLAFGSRLEGLVAVARQQPLLELSELKLADSCLLAVLEAVEKPGNLGAILRAADGAGLDAVILADQRSDPFSPNAIRASTGVVFSMPLYTASSLATREWLAQQGCQLLASRVDAVNDYRQVNWTGKIAVVLGEEAAGLSDCWSGSQVQDLRIPMRGQADSLNVASSAAILFYEARRQQAD